MKLFSKRKESNSEPNPNAISKGVQAGYKRLQGGWADWMMRRTEKFSRRTWVVLLVLFVLSVSTYSVYIAVSAFTGKGSNSITITPIKKPKHATETGDASKEAAEVSEAEYSRIKKFSAYMDSLARSPSGQVLYDSITSHRPGLMDSVRFIENYYQQLKQK
jgi:multidrug efflux pump subunit AcrB